MDTRLGGSPANDQGHTPLPGNAQERDQAGRQRDVAGRHRDQAAHRRDRSADHRDDVANERDQLAVRSEALEGAGLTSESLESSARARSAAASDRRRAGQDRRAAASERDQAGQDRATALADRGASASERDVASIDELTGVYHRGAGLLELQREIDRARRSEQPLVLVFLDVDHLKVINDTHGHAAGDRLLVEVANTLATKLRSYDPILRYGGDEFLCALSGLSATEVRKRLVLVDAALAQGVSQGSVTVGLAELRAADTLEDLVARADCALYHERLLRGRNRL